MRVRCGHCSLPLISSGYPPLHTEARCLRCGSTARVKPEDAPEPELVEEESVEPPLKPTRSRRKLHDDM